MYGDAGCTVTSPEVVPNAVTLALLASYGFDQSDAVSLGMTFTGQPDACVTPNYAIQPAVLQQVIDLPDNVRNYEVGFRTSCRTWNNGANDSAASFCFSNTPTTSEPTTSEPSPAPTTAEPTTSEPTTSEPTTSEPTTSEPTTSEPSPVPTTAEPTTSEPTTSEPTTSEPTTRGPTGSPMPGPTTPEPTPAPTTPEPTPAPTTLEPTTSEPTTSEPSPAPSTSEPTTSEPTTSEPTTSEPTTSDPTTSEPTTSEPTPAPSTGPTPSPSVAPTVGCIDYLNGDQSTQLDIAIGFSQPQAPQTTSRSFATGSKIILTASCDSCLSGSHMTYEWGNGDPPHSSCEEASDAADDGFDAVDCAAHTTTGCARRSLAILGSAGISAARLYVRITERVAEGGAVVGSSVRAIQLIANAPPAGGSCSIVAASSYVALAETYAITCAGYTDGTHTATQPGPVDGNGNSNGLHYTFSAVTPAGAVSALYEGPLSSVAVYLPAGSITLRYSVADRLSSAAVTDQTIAVSGAAAMRALLDTITQGDGSLLATTVAANDVTATVGLLGALSHTLAATGGGGGGGSAEASQAVLEATISLAADHGISLTLAQSATVLAIAADFTSNAGSFDTIESATTIVENIVTTAAASGDLGNFVDAAINAGTIILNTVRQDTGSSIDSSSSAGQSANDRERVGLMTRVETAIGRAVLASLSQSSVDEGPVSFGSASAVEVVASRVNCDSASAGSLTGASSTVGYGGVCETESSALVSVQYSSDPYPGTNSTVHGPVSSLDVHNTATGGSKVIVADRESCDVSIDISREAPATARRIIHSLGARSEYKGTFNHNAATAGATLHLVVEPLHFADGTAAEMELVVTRGTMTASETATETVVLASTSRRSAGVTLPDDVHDATYTVQIGAEPIDATGCSDSEQYGATDGDALLSSTVGVDSQYTFSLRNIRNRAAKFQVHVFSSDCKWFNATAGDWDSSGCSVSVTSTPDRLRCSCNHLTAFGGGFAVEAEPVEIRAITADDLAKNPVVLVILIVMWASYLLTLRLAINADRKTRTRIEPIELKAKVGTVNSGVYEVVVKTGMRPSAGSTGKICIQLLGDKGKSTEHFLEHASRPVCQRHSVEVFLLPTRHNLGTIRQINIRQDPSADIGGSWFANRVRITNLSDGIEVDTTRYFMINDWLGLEAADGVVERLVDAQTPDEVAATATIVSQQLTDSFASFHPWISPFLRPSGSRFTRAERVTVLATFIFMAMLTSAMYYQDDGQELTTAEQIYIGLVSTLILVVPASILVTLFSRSRRRTKPSSSDIDPDIGAALTAATDDPVPEARPVASAASLRASSNWKAAAGKAVLEGAVPAPTPAKARWSAAAAAAASLPPVRAATAPSKWKVLASKAAREEAPAVVPTKAKARWSAAGAAAASLPPVRTAVGPNKWKAAALKAAPLSTAPQVAEIPTTSIWDSIAKSSNAKAGRRSSVGSAGSGVEAELKLFAMLQTTRARRQSVASTAPDEAPVASKQGFSANSVAAAPRPVAALSKWGKARASVGLDVTATAAPAPITGLSKWGKARASLGLAGSDTSTSASGPGFAAFGGDDSGDGMAGLSSAWTELLSQLPLDKVQQHLFVTDAGRHKFTLPRFMVAVAWALSLGLMVLSSYLLLLYSFKWGATISLMWFHSFLAAIIASIFLVHPFAIVILALLLTALFRKFEDQVLPDDDDGLSDAAFVPASDAADDVSGRNAIDELISAPKRALPASVDKRREQAERNKKMRGIVQEIVGYTLFYAALSQTLFADHDQTRYQFANAVYDNFGNFGPWAQGDKGYVGKTNWAHTIDYAQRDSSFSGISTVDDLWSWLEDDFVKGLHWNTWYNGGAVSTQGYTLNPPGTVLLGAVRLRQLRVKDQGCALPDEFKDSIQECHSTWSESENAEADMHGSGTDNDTEIWSFSSNTAGAASWGEFGDVLYSEGGYIVELPRSTDNATAVIHELERARWLDDKSRALFVEFNVYNVAANLIMPCTLMVELPGTGGLIPSVHMYPFKVYRYGGDDGWLLVTLEVIVVGVVAAFTLSVITSCRKVGPATHLRNPWNVFLAIHVLFALFAIAVYIAKLVWIEDALRLWRAADRDRYFEHFAAIAEVQQPVAIMLGLTIWMATINFIRLVRHNKRVKMMLAIMAHAAVQIWGFALWFGIVFCSYAMLGFIWFSPTVESFKTLPDALYTLTSVVLGEFDRDAGDWGKPDQITMPLFMVTFSILTKFWTLNMFVAILNYSTLMVQTNHAGIDNDLDLWRYLYRQICMLMGWKTEDAITAPRNAVNTNATLEQMLLDIVGRLNVKLPQLEDTDREMLAPPSAPGVLHTVHATFSVPVPEKEEREGHAPAYPDRLLKRESLVLEFQAADKTSVRTVRRISAVKPVPAARAAAAAEDAPAGPPVYPDRLLKRESQVLAPLPVPASVSVKLPALRAPRTKFP